MNLFLIFSLLLALPVFADIQGAAQCVLAGMSVIPSTGAPSCPYDELSPVQRLGACPTQEDSRCTRRENGNEVFNALGPGEHRLMRRPTTGTKSYTTGDYLLRNLDGNHFQAVINLDFKPRGSILASQMLSKTRECLSEMRPYLRGPDNKGLDIVVVTPELDMPNGLPKPKAREVSVTSQGDDYRGDATNFGSNFRCRTIGHEILHHLGLCDEYHENPSATDNRYLQWSCRVVTTQPSYMRNIFTGFDMMVPQTVACTCDDMCQFIMNGTNEDAKKTYLSMNGEDFIGNESSLRPFCQRTRITTAETQDATPTDPGKPFVFNGRQGNVYTFDSREVYATTLHDSAWNEKHNHVYWPVDRYTCDCSSDTNNYCHRMMTQLQTFASSPPIPKPRCPANTNPTEPSRVRAPAQTVEPMIGSSGATAIENGILMVRTPGNGQSLLARGHFGKILAGECEGGSPNYERCEAFANIPETDHKCKDRDQCYNDDYYLNQQNIPAFPH